MIKQGPQNHRSSAKNYLKSLRNQNPPPILDIFTLQPSEIAFLSNSRLKNRKERLNRSANNG